MIKITGGNKRGMNLYVPEGHDIRPTPSRVREAVFNALQSRINLNDARVLDIFSGSGVMGLEAYSRGAQKVIFLDQSSKSIDASKRNAGLMKQAKSFDFITANATKPPRTTTPVDLIFIDPPYGKSLGEESLISLLNAGWIDDDTLVVLEESSKAELSIPEKFEILKQKKYGSTTVYYITAV